MTDKPKGIVDPWRKVDAVHPTTTRPPPTETQTRIDPDQIDFDADLAIPGKYVIRSEHTSFAVTSVKVATPQDALKVLIECILGLARIRTVGNAFVTAGIGVQLGKVLWNAPSGDTPASALRSGDNTVWFVEKPLDQGMLVLARLLRGPEAAAACRSHGIVVMLNA